MKIMKLGSRCLITIDKQEFLAGCIFGTCVAGMVMASMLSLADFASKPAVHSAPTAVMQHYQSPPSTLPDQERATLVSLSWSAPDHLLIAQAEGMTNGVH